jgi:sigma-B regulation protein RsbU (phosphoserine phosphatase)
MYPVESPAIPGYETAWLTRSCDETGGDYMDFLTLDGGSVGFAIGDVSGHGIGAALLMAAARAYLRGLISLQADLRDVVERLNDLLSRDMNAEKFMTLFLAVLDPRSHEIRYVCAGHDQPLVYRAASGDVEEIGSTGLPLGMLQGWAYEVGSIAPLEPGDALLLTTDGVWEALSQAGNPLGKARIGMRLAASGGGSARGIVDAILKEVDAHTLGAVAADDSTLVVLKRLEKPGQRSPGPRPGRRRKQALSLPVVLAPAHR